MSEYEDGRLIASLRANFWSPDEAGEEIFNSFKDQFVRKTAQQRPVRVSIALGEAWRDGFRVDALRGLL
jgi:hypothetical protein